MSKRATILLSLIGIIGIMVCASCNPSPSPAPVLATVPVSTLPASIPTDTPLPSPTSTVTKTPVPASCPWVPYFYDGETVNSPDNEECLEGLKGIRVFDNLKQISFFVNRSSHLGTYGVCRDISREGDLKFNVTINDSMVSTRFMIMVSPKPIPTNKSSFGFRVQPQIFGNEKGLWVKWIEYASDDFENDIGGLQAIPDWKHNHVWNFDFSFQFSGSQATVSMNKKALSRVWPLSSSTRYLCFAYQMTPTADNAAELEAQVSFP